MDSEGNESKKPEQTAAAPEKFSKKKEKGFWARMAAKKLDWLVFFLCTALIIVVVWPFCTITVEAGHVGVYFSRLFGGTLVDRTYSEGLHFLLPWDTLTQYDKRLQSKLYNVAALTRGGLNVNVDMSVLWYIKPEEAGRLHILAGPDYTERVIDPAVISTIRSVIGSHEQSRLYDGNPLQLQSDVLKLLGNTFTDTPFIIHSILIREVRLPDSIINAISEKFVAEQTVLEARYTVLESIETFKKNFVEAESIRLAQSIVNDGMSEAYLRYMGIKATLKLAESDNAKLVVIGDKDGMPLILNPDTMGTSATLPEKSPPEGGYIQEAEVGARLGELTDSYAKMDKYLDSIHGVLGELAAKFPEIAHDMKDTDLPQTNQVPSAPKKED
jgi:regulator of protease activity HflC (stomatin/prohibitin superfamily)